MNEPHSSLAFMADAVDTALTAPDVPRFLEGIQEGFSALYRHLVLNTKTRKKSLQALEDAFASSRSSIRRRRILELCAWPVFDKPALPLPPTGGLPEFLWIFTVPFVVTLTPAQLVHPLLLEGEVLPAAQLLALAERSGCLNKKAAMRTFSTLFRREDLHAYGPQNIAAIFVGAELGINDVPVPLPILMDEEMESFRNVTLLALCSARLPLGESSLYRPGMLWPCEEAAQVVLAGLRAQGLEVEAVKGLAPCSVAESLFHCAGSGLAELEMNLKAAQATYGDLQVILKYPMEGFAEVNAFNSVGAEISILPTFAFFEPKAALTACVRQICAAQAIGYKGTFNLSIPAGSLLQ